MIRERPAFGVGIGQVLPDIRLVPVAGSWRGRTASRTRTTIFFRSARELGVAALVVFTAWIGVVLVRSARAIAAAPRDWRLVGAAAATATVCVTSMAGHPLLVHEVMFPFWMLFGLTAGLAGTVSVAPSARRTASRMAGTRKYAMDRGGRHRGNRDCWGGGQRGAAAARASGVGRGRWLLRVGDGRGRHPVQVERPGRQPVRAGRRETAAHIPMRMPSSARTVTPDRRRVMSGGLSKGRVIITDVWAEIVTFRSGTCRRRRGTVAWTSGSIAPGNRRSTFRQRGPEECRRAGGRASPRSRPLTVTTPLPTT